MADRHSSSPFFYGWVVVAICFVTVAISYGIRYSFSVFYASILQEFGWNRAETALIFSINVIIYGLAAPIVGAAVDRLGPRKFMAGGAVILGIAVAACSQAQQMWHFYLLFGLLASLGICATGYVPNTVLVSRWFIQRRGTALGIFMAGFGLAYIMAIVVERFIADIGWRNTFALLGLLPIVVTAPLIAIFQRLEPKEKGLTPDGRIQVEARGAPQSGGEPLVIDRQWAEQKWNIPKAIKTYRFWLIFIGNFFLWGIAVNLVMAHQVVFAVDQGYTRTFGALIFSLYGIFYSLGNLMGFISDRVGREVALTLGLTVAGLGVLMLILNRGSSTPWLMYAYSLLFGLGIGVTSPALTGAAADLFLGPNFGSINGLIVMGFGLGGSISPWLGGIIFDILGTYIPAFSLVIAALVIAAICLWLAGPRKVRLVSGKRRRN